MYGQRSERLKHGGGGGLIWTIISTSEITFVMFYFEENPENS